MRQINEFSSKSLNLVVFLEVAAPCIPRGIQGAATFFQSSKPGQKAGEFRGARERAAGAGLGANNKLVRGFGTAADKKTSFPQTTESLAIPGVPSGLRVTLGISMRFPGNLQFLSNFQRISARAGPWTF